MTIHHTPTRTINNTGGYRQCKRVRHNGTYNVSAQRINCESNLHRVEFNPYYLRLHAARPHAMRAPTQLPDRRCIPPSPSTSKMPYSIAPQRVTGISADPNMLNADGGDMLNNNCPPSTPRFTTSTVSCPAEASSMDPCSV